MPGWIRWLFRGRRDIFRWHDGTRTRYSDPLVIARKLDESGGDGWGANINVLALSMKKLPAELSEELKKERAKQEAESIAELVRITREAFDVKALGDDGSGLTEAETVGLLAQWVAWMDRMEEEARPTLSSSRATESCPAN